MYYYTCLNCHLTFARTTEQEQCPECGKHRLKPASEERMAELQKYLSDDKPFFIKE